MTGDSSFSSLRKNDAMQLSDVGRQIGAIESHA
jgi:hypothetical protein